MFSLTDTNRSVKNEPSKQRPLSTDGKEKDSSGGAGDEGPGRQQLTVDRHQKQEDHRPERSGPLAKPTIGDAIEKAKQKKSKQSTAQKKSKKNARVNSTHEERPARSWTTTSSAHRAALTDL